MKQDSQSRNGTDRQESKGVEEIKDMVVTRLAELFWRHYQWKRQQSPTKKGFDNPRTKIVTSKHETKKHHHR